MQFSVQWAGVSIVYVGMVAGCVGGWLTSGDDVGPTMRVFVALVTTLFGGGATIPFLLSNFAAALLARRVTSDRPFTKQFATFAALALGFGWIMLGWVDEALGPMGGLHLDASEVAKWGALQLAALALALILMRFAPTHRAG